jgi:hypothetical protein
MSNPDSLSFRQIEADRNLVRSEVIEYLRDNEQRMSLRPPPPTPDAALAWRDQTCAAGKPLSELVDDVYERLLSSGKATVTLVRVNASTIMHAYDAYYPARTKFLILQEVSELIRTGVLVEVRFFAERPKLSYDCGLKFGAGHVVLTEYGSRYLTEAGIVPHSAEQYLSVLRQIKEPDDVLVGYTTEGLACLRHHLFRAAAILLRAASEHTLDSLVDSTLQSLGSEKERQSLERRIRHAGIRIEQRAEVVSAKLESAQGLVPHRDTVTNRLRPAFHAIRELGGKAAHLASSFDRQDVRNHYTLYASSVFAPVMEIIDHQGSVASL